MERRSLWCAASRDPASPCCWLESACQRRLRTSPRGARCRWRSSQVRVMRRVRTALRARRPVRPRRCRRPRRPAFLGCRTCASCTGCQMRSWRCTTMWRAPRCASLCRSGDRWRRRVRCRCRGSCARRLRRCMRRAWYTGTSRPETWWWPRTARTSSTWGLLACAWTAPRTIPRALARGASRRRSNMGLRRQTQGRTFFRLAAC